MYEIKSHPILKNQKALYATKVIDKGTVVFDVSNLPIMSMNNMYAITVCKGLYLDTIGTDAKLINHCCNPTLIFDTDYLVFTAKTNIAKGDMLTFDYTLTELEISAPFDCICGNDKCKGYIGTITNKKPIKIENSNVNKT